MPPTNGTPEPRQQMMASSDEQAYTARSVVEALVPRPVTDEEFEQLLNFYTVAYVEWRLGNTEVWDILEPASAGYELGMDLSDRFERFGSEAEGVSSGTLRKMTVQCGGVAAAAAVTCFLLGWVA